LLYLVLLCGVSVIGARAGEQRLLYPPIQPYHSGYLKVSDGHSLYYEESGNPRGTPALYLHGGPGTGCKPAQRRFFDPARYRIVLFDQRGAGKSLPAGSIEHNTTRELINDIEALRHALHVKRWVIYGGSWGSTLALAYAEMYPERVAAMVLRGIFLGRPPEMDWSYRPGGVARQFPDAYGRFRDHIPPAERGDLLAAYHRRITGTDPRARSEAVRCWNEFEECTDMLVRKSREQAPLTIGDIGRAVIEVHYLQNQAFLTPNQLLQNIERIRRIPAVIIQGRYDMICPLETAWALHLAWPEADFRIVPDAGHSWKEPGTISQTILATDRFR
jgi:proline iminopeptidase